MPPLVTRANVPAVVDVGRRRDRGNADGVRWCATATRRGTRAMRAALRPNEEWPPEDVWEDFVAAHAGE